MKTALEGLGTKAKGKFGDELGGRVINAADRRVASQWLNFFGRFQKSARGLYTHAVARAKSEMKPDRFLVINIRRPDTCQNLYNTIKQRVLGDVQDFDISPEQLAEMIWHGLCGPKKTEDPSQALNKPLPKTKNSCWINIDSTLVTGKKMKNFPILVIDEFNQEDFTTRDKDYSLNELSTKIGEAFQFFKHLTGFAHK
eukprot:scaffold28789_cov92-Amphora_coffeaeformis.AAC.1